MTDKEFISWLEGYIDAYKRTSMMLNQDDLDIIKEKIELTKVKTSLTFPGTTFTPSTGGLPLTPYCGTIPCGSVTTQGLVTGTVTGYPAGTTVNYTVSEQK